MLIEPIESAAPTIGMMALLYVYIFICVTSYILVLFFFLARLPVPLCAIKVLPESLEACIHFLSLRGRCACCRPQCFGLAQFQIRTYNVSPYLKMITGEYGQLASGN